MKKYIFLFFIYLLPINSQAQIQDQFQSYWGFVLLLSKILFVVVGFITLIYGILVLKDIKIPVDKIKNFFYTRKGRRRRKIQNRPKESKYKVIRIKMFVTMLGFLLLLSFLLWYSNEEYSRGARYFPEEYVVPK